MNSKILGGFVVLLTSVFLPLGFVEHVSATASSADFSIQLEGSVFHSTQLQSESLQSNSFVSTPLSVGSSESFQVSVGEAAVCGNGIQEGSEQCDGSDLNGFACSDFNFNRGQLSCSSSCRFDTSTCSDAGRTREDDEVSVSNTVVVSLDSSAATSGTASVSVSSSGISSSSSPAVVQQPASSESGLTGGSESEVPSEQVISSDSRETSSVSTDETEESAGSVLSAAEGSRAPEDSSLRGAASASLLMIPGLVEPALIVPERLVQENEDVELVAAPGVEVKEETQEPSLLTPVSEEKSGTTLEQGHVSSVAKFSASSLSGQNSSASSLPSVLPGWSPEVTSVEHTSAPADDDYRRTLSMVSLPADLDEALENKSRSYWFMFFSVILVSVLLVLLLFIQGRLRVLFSRSSFKRTKHLLLALALGGVLSLQSSHQVFAQENTTPDVFPYMMMLTNNEGNPITTEHNVRFSLWSNVDMDATDVNPDGSINVNAVSYSDWTEEHTVTPQSSGMINVWLGSVTPLPTIAFSDHQFLQIEVKSSSAPSTSYQLMDPTGDDGADANDRQVLATSLYAENANRVDNREVGTSEGQLATLGVNGRWTTSQIPGGTDQDAFILDADDSVAAGSLSLQFGASLSRFFSYNIDADRFELNDDLNIQGNLSFTGTINGAVLDQTLPSQTEKTKLSELVDDADADITLGDKNISDIHSQHTDTGTTQSTFVINSSASQLILDTTGLTANRLITFPDVDSMMVGLDTVQTLTNKTIDGDDNTVQDLEWSSLKTREYVETFVAEFPHTVIIPTGNNDDIDVSVGVEQTVNPHQYYVMQSTASELQDSYIKLKFRLPDSFVDFSASNDISFFYKNTGTDVTDSRIDILVEDDEGDDAFLAADGENLFSSNWAEFTDEFDQGDFDPQAGEYIYITLRVYASYDGANQSPYVGELLLRFMGR